MKDETVALCDEHIIGFGDGNECELCSLKQTVRTLADALMNLDDGVECRLDHHGCCQSHFIEKECSMAQARAALSDPIVKQILEEK